MKRALKLLVFASMAVGMARAAENPFIGEWKLNPSMSRMPDEMKVESKGGNTYSFNFGGGAETIVADGTYQPGYRGTMLSVKADGRDTWIVERKKDGRLLLKATWKLSKDGGTLADFYREFEPDGSTLSMDYVYQRSGGGSGFAADWQSIKETMNSPFVLQVKAYQGDGLSFITPSEHETKNVKLDGKDYPDQGPNAGPGSSSSIRRVEYLARLQQTDVTPAKLALATQQFVTNYPLQATIPPDPGTQHEMRSVLDIMQLATETFVSKYHIPLTREAVSSPTGSLAPGPMASTSPVAPKAPGN